MATATRKQARGFAHRCPLCGAEDSVLCRLEDVSSIHCDQCNEEITAEVISELLGAWKRVLAWLDTAPARDEEG